MLIIFITRLLTKMLLLRAVDQIKKINPLMHNVPKWSDTL